MSISRKSSSTKSVEFHQVSVKHPLVHRRVPTFKEWLVRGGTRDEVDAWFMALKDVSFQIPAGDTLGVIGSNGAGKSTLLRVAAGIITPTSGYAVIRGSIAPLIELGTGFDGELTGLENIFFNGALLGRKRAEIRLKVDEIVNFADIGEFIDAPLRTYSTGMVSRLAFAIATTIDPDVLLLDEILSVGDASFQQKCKDRILNFWNRGTTIMLVSHDLDTVEELCTNAIWIAHGEAMAYGPASEVVAQYLEATAPALVEHSEAPSPAGVS
ncbi:MAG: ABC transporter ATP-binding protein [Acidobacteriota bacterium]